MQSATHPRPEAAPLPPPAAPLFERARLGDLIDALSHLEILAAPEPPRWMDEPEQEASWWERAERLGDEARRLLGLAGRSVAAALSEMSDGLEDEVMGELGLDFWHGIACLPHPVLGWNFTYEEGRAYKRARYDGFWSAALAADFGLEELNARYEAR